MTLDTTPEGREFRVKIMANDLVMVTNRTGASPLLLTQDEARDVLDGIKLALDALELTTC